MSRVGLGSIDLISTWFDILIFPKVPGHTFFLNLPKITTSAAAPLVLTPFVRNQRRPIIIVLIILIILLILNKIDRDYYNNNDNDNDNHYYDY